MKLTTITLHGYKAFADKTSLDVSGKLVALIGPNEAGKTSILNAIARLSDDEKFKLTGVERELTRDVEIDGGQQVVTATYLLEGEDREAIRHIPGAETVSRFVINKQASGSFSFLVYGTIPRDPRFRARCIAGLSAGVENEVLKAAAADPESSFRLEHVAELLPLLGVDAKNLPQSTKTKVANLQRLLAGMQEESEDEGLDSLMQILRELTEYEARDPVAPISDALVPRQPEFLLFDDDDRDLKGEYDFFLPVAEIPVSLRNLAHLAGLDLAQLRRAVEGGETWKVQSLKDNANQCLRKVFEESWSQSGVSVQIDTNQNVLYVHIRKPGGDLDSIAERSDGLRQFVALLAFVSTRGTSTPPILLIDEAELHLHYDAQADLVQMLARQQVAGKVIYSTHSIGCLPEDLGTGIRMIVPQAQPNRSVIQNWFWASHEPGFSPLLYGMGASTLAFIPVRYAVVVEGATDAILLPSLLREATEREHLGYQIVPGLSEVSKDGVSLLDREGKRVIFLADSDGGGDTLRDMLLDAGIPKGRILQLPRASNRGLVVEDLLDKHVYHRAVNYVLREVMGVNIELPMNAIPATLRPNAVEQWCRANGVGVPQKRVVAYAALDMRVEMPIVHGSRSAALIALHESIVSGLSAAR